MPADYAGLHLRWWAVSCPRRGPLFLVYLDRADAVPVLAWGAWERRHEVLRRVLWDALDGDL